MAKDDKSNSVMMNILKNRDLKRKQFIDINETVKYKIPQIRESENFSSNLLFKHKQKYARQR